MKREEEKQSAKELTHYSEGPFKLMAVPSKAGYYQGQVPRFQAYKFHFHCPDPGEVHSAFLQEVIERWVDESTRQRLAPCCKLFDQAEAVSCADTAEFARLSGHASGTLYLPDFEQSSAVALAQLALDLSERFAHERIVELDYSVGFLPYCPGVFIRQAFQQVSAYPNRYEYIPALQVERALEARETDPGAYTQLRRGINARSELRKNPMYVAVCDELHDRQIKRAQGLVAAQRQGSRVVSAVFKAGIMILLALMRWYKEKGYSLSRALLRSLTEAQKTHPVLCKGELAQIARQFQAELTRANAYLTHRLGYKKRIDPWIRQERARRAKRLLEARVKTDRPQFLASMNRR